MEPETVPLKFGLTAIYVTYEQTHDDEEIF